MDKMKFETPDMTAENIEKIAALFPNCVTEMRDESGNLKRGINFEMLRQMLSPDVVDGDECYEFTWVGKKASVVEAYKPIRKTLRPCPEESKDWDATENLYIEGDNLEVLKLLQESYLGKVKMIYIDPPYNTGNDFIYADDFMRSQEEENEQMGMYDEDKNRLFKNTDSNGRFHSDWCSMMYSRLMLARNLLSDDGLAFISIGEHEVHNLKEMALEIFGSSNFIETYIWESTFRPDNSSKIMRRNAEYVMCLAKDINKIKRLIGEIKQKEGLPSLTKASMRESVLRFPANTVKTFLQNGTYKKGVRDSYELLDDVIVKDGIIENGFRLKGRMIWGQENLEREISDGTEIIIKGDGFVPYTKKAGDSIMSPTKIIPKSLVGDILSSNAEFAQLFETKVFSYPKPVSLLKYLIHYYDDKDFFILDFFSGSATTAHAVMQLNAEDGGHRKFIMVQLPEPCDEKSEAYKVGYKNICEIGKERIRRAGEKIKAEGGLTAQNLDVGFRVLKLADSNMKDVYYAADDYTQDLLVGLESNIKDDRSELDLLFGCLIDWGLPLSLPYTSEQIEGCTVHTYNDGDLIACFDANIPESVVKEIASRKPLRAVFRDSSFASSPSKINVFEIFKIYMPEDADDITKRVRVI